MKDNKLPPPPKAGRQNAVQAANSIEANCAYSEMMSVADLKHHPQNPNQHSEGQLRLIQKVLAHQGWRSPLIVSNLSGFVVCGNGRLMAARAMGLDEVPVDRQDFASEADEIAHLLADNKIASLAELDNDLLKEVLLELDTGAIDMDLTGFDSSELEDLMTQFHVDEENDAEPKIEKADELQKKWGTKPGQVWGLGNHRLACGDCTSSEVTQKLMESEKAELVWTDPPWNVAYGESKNPQWKQRKIKNDNLGVEFPKFAKAFCEQIKNNSVDGGMLYMAMSAQEWPTIDEALRAAGFHWSSTIIWAKDTLVLSRKDYHTQYEPIWYGWNDAGPRVSKLADRKQSDLWNIDRPKRSEEHPTMKPLELVSRSVANSSSLGDIVYDPFLGSGTTLIACENLGRKCRAIEIAPEYVAVAIERWHEVTGKSPELLDGPTASL